MNTGIQRSSSTPRFARTTTSPVGSAGQGKPQNKKDITEIMVAHHIPLCGSNRPFGELQGICTSSRTKPFIPKARAFEHIIPLPPGLGLPCVQAG